MARWIRLLALILRPLPEAKDWVEIVVSLLSLLGISASFVVTSWLVNRLTGLMSGGLVVVASLLGLTFIALYRTQEMVDRYRERPKPKLVSDAPYTNRRPWSSKGPNGTDIIVGQPYFASIHIRNDPDIRATDAAASNVIAKMSFFTIEGDQLLFTLYGRWGGGTNQPRTMGRYTPTEDLLGIDFPPNGLARELNIAMKYEEDDECYGFSNDSYSFPDGRDRARTLAGDRFRIEIRLQGVGMENDETLSLTLINRGRGKGIELIPLMPNNSAC